MKAEERMASVRPKDSRFLWSARSILVLCGVLDPQPCRAFEGKPAAPVAAVPEAALPAACRFDAVAWSGPVRVSPELAAFVTVESAHRVTVAIPEGDAAQGARASLEVLGVRLDALVVARDLEIYLKKPQLFGGYVWAGSAAVVHWTRAMGERLAYQVVLPARVSPASGPPFGERACKELSLESEGDDEIISRAILAGRRSAQLTRWRGDERVPLARAVGQPPLAFLDTRATCVSEDAEVACEVPEPDEVLVLERRAKSSRVAYQVETVWVVGWVPNDALRMPFERVDTADLMLFGTPLWPEPVQPFGENDPTLARGDAKTLCAWNAPLAAEVSGVVRTVGTIASDIPLVTGAQRQGWREVVLEHPALSFAEGARSWVPERFLYPCRPLPLAMRGSGGSE